MAWPIIWLVHEMHAQLSIIVAYIILTQFDNVTIR